MSLSRAFLRADAVPELGTFASLLPRVEEPKVEAKLLRGRSAELLQKLRDTAVSEGREEGYHEGFAEGQQEAFEATRMSMEASVVAFQQALDQKAESVAQAMDAWYASAEENLAALAAVVAARILGRELEVSKDTVTELTREAIRHVAAVDKARIRVHPFDVPLLAEKKAMILAAGSTLKGVEIVDDETIEGGVKIESDAGLIDATMRTQLELAFETLRRPV